jgi:hypothetical protein
LKKLISITAIAAIAVVAFVPAASAATKARTKVTIDALFLSAGQTHWSGDIFSPRKACKHNRRVLIYKVRPGPDEKFGSTKSFKGLTAPTYHWTYFEWDAAPVGNYYAKVKPTDRCQGDRSGSYHGPASL